MAFDQAAWQRELRALKSGGPEQARQMRVQWVHVHRRRGTLGALLPALRLSWHPDEPREIGLFDIDAAVGDAAVIAAVVAVDDFFDDLEQGAVVEVLGDPVPGGAMLLRKQGGATLPCGPGHQTSHRVPHLGRRIVQVRRGSRLPLRW